MDITGLKAVLSSILALILGFVASLIALITPMKEEAPQLLTRDTPTPTVAETTRTLTHEEAATMSASFIREFELMQSSGSGEQK